MLRAVFDKEGLKRSRERQRREKLSHSLKVGAPFSISAPPGPRPPPTFNEEPRTQNLARIMQEP